MKENLKPCVYKLWELWGDCFNLEEGGDDVKSSTAYFLLERSGELRLLARLRSWKVRSGEYVPGSWETKS